MFLLLAACTPATIDLGGKDGPGVSDTAADADADTDTDTDSDSDTDTEPVVTDAGDFEGEVDGHYTWEGGEWAGHGGSDEDYELPCSGDFAVTLSEHGDLSGSASCTDEWRGDTIEGDIVGTAIDGRVTGTWTVGFPWGDSTFDLDGNVADGVIALSLDEDLGRGQRFSAELHGRR